VEGWRAPWKPHTCRCMLGVRCCGWLGRKGQQPGQQAKRQARRPALPCSLHGGAGPWRPPYPAVSERRALCVQSALYQCACTACTCSCWRGVSFGIPKATGAGQAWGARCAVVRGMNMLQGRMLVVLYGSCSGCSGWVLLTVQLLRLCCPGFASISMCTLGGAAGVVG
jgi:hypothetical protein